MSAVFNEPRPNDLELEQLWRHFHAALVRADEELAKALQRIFEQQQRGVGYDELDAAFIQMLRTQERQCHAVLEQYEQRLHRFRSRTARFRAGYR